MSYKRKTCPRCGRPNIEMKVHCQACGYYIAKDPPKLKICNDCGAYTKNLVVRNLGKFITVGIICDGCNKVTITKRDVHISEDLRQENTLALMGIPNIEAPLIKKH